LIETLKKKKNCCDVDDSRFWWNPGNYHCLAATRVRRVAKQLFLSDRTIRITVACLDWLFWTVMGEGGSPTWIIVDYNSQTTLYGINYSYYNVTIIALSYYGMTKISQNGGCGTFIPSNSWARPWRIEWIGQCRSSSGTFRSGTES